MRDSSRHPAVRAAGAIAALSLAAGLFIIADPAAIGALLGSVEPAALVIATAAYAAVLALRGARLRLLLPAAELRPARAVLIAAAGRAAALFLPLRAGELVLPWLLKRRAGVDLATGLAGLLAARALDLAALAVWGAGALLWVTGARTPAIIVAVLLVIPLVALPAAAAWGERAATRLLGHRGETGRRWADRIARLRAALDAIRHRPVRLGAAVAASLVIWGLVWSLTWTLLYGMGRTWPVGMVVAGSAASAVANLLPLNLVANLGTLEAGWTAAFTAQGIPAPEAAATGFATHALSLLINAALGGAAWLVLLARGDSRRSVGDRPER